MGTNGTAHPLPHAILTALAGADRRRRVRLVLVGVTRALWAGLAVGVAALVAWRLSGATWWLVVAFAAVAFAALVGAARGARRRDLAAAAVELDRACGLDASLATALEVAHRPSAGDVSAAAVRQAESAAGRIDPESVPTEPGGRSRFLVIPGAVFAAALLLPVAGPSSTRTFVPALGAGGATDAASTGELEPDGAKRPREGATRAKREDVVRALKAKAESVELAERAREPLKPPAERRRDRSRSRGKRNAAGDEKDNDETGSGGSALSRAGAVALDGGDAPVDVREKAVAREYFPEYGEVVRRYFGGAGE